MKKLILSVIACSFLCSCAVKPKYTTAQCDNMKNIMFDKEAGGSVEMFKLWASNCVDYSKIGHGPRKFPKYYRVRVSGSNGRYTIRVR